MTREETEKEVARLREEAAEHGRQALQLYGRAQVRERHHTSMRDLKAAKADALAATLMEEK